jgi:hypothetical protein
LIPKPNIIRMIKSRRKRLTGIQHAWGKREICKHIGWKAQGKRLHRIPRGRWQNNIKMDLKEKVGGCGLV